MKNTLLSFVIPCFRSEKTIESVVAELSETLKTRSEFDAEIILVNDGSPDETADILAKLAERDSRIVFVDLARNFGQHCAVMAGFHQVQGDIIICLDDDGQTPAEECFKLIDKVLEGYDLVFAKYPKHKQSGFRNLGSKFNTWCNHYFFNQPKHIQANSYYACKRYVVDNAIAYPNPYPYVTGLLLQSVNPKRCTNVEVNHRAREIGSSGYTLRKLISLWTNGVTSFSIKPLRFANYIGWSSAFIGFVFAIVTVIRKIINPDIQAGWASIIAILLVLGGVIIVLIGMLGEYVGRMYLSINRSPQFVVRSIMRSNPAEKSQEGK